jgi:FMN reductase
MTRRPFIVGIAGTLRDKSRTRTVMQEALKLAEVAGAETEFLDLQTLNLPMYVPYLPVNDYPTPHRDTIQNFLQSVHRAHALLWCSPTYHGTVSGIFKNALDMLELLSEHTPPYLSGKVVGLIAVADPRTLTSMVDSVHELRGWLAPSQTVLEKDDFDAERQLVPGRPIRRLQRLVNELLEFSHWQHLASLGGEAPQDSHNE